MPTTPPTGLAVLLVAAGCTVGGQQPHPAPTSPAATTPTSADPLAALRRSLHLPTLKPDAPCPVARAHQVAPASPRCWGMDPPT